MNARKVLPPALVAAAVLAAFLPVLRNGFVNWDDRVILLQNPYFRGLGWDNIRWMFSNFTTGKYQPVSWLTFGLDYLIWGMNPAGYHLTALLWHAAAAVLLYFLCLRLLPFSEESRPLAAAFAALFFALHPLRVEAVAWASDRGDPVSGVFYLATILLYLRGSILLSCLCYAGSLLSKATGITLPAVLLLLDVYPLRRPLKESLIAKVPFGMIALVFAFVGLSGQASEGALASLARYPLGERLAQACFAPVFYLAKTLMPFGLAPLYLLRPRLSPAPFFLSAVVVAVATGALLHRRRSQPWALAVWLGYLLILLPVSGLVTLGLSVAADRYSYLPAFALALAAGAGAGRWLGEARGDFRARAIPLGALLIGLAVLTVGRLGAWRNSVTFWSQALAAEPDCYACRANLGTALLAEGREKESREHAAAAQVLLAKARFELGASFYEAGRYEEARLRFAEALEAFPNSAESENALGLSLMKLDRPAEAAPHFAAAAKLKPDFAEALGNWGAALLSTGKIKEAGARFADALALEPQNLPAAIGLQQIASGALPPAK